MEALPTKEGMQVGVLLFRPDDERVLGLKSAADARALFQVKRGQEDCVFLSLLFGGACSALVCEETESTRRCAKFLFVWPRLFFS